MSRLRSRGRLQLGRRVCLCPGARVSVARGARVVLGDGSVLGPDSRVQASTGSVTIGPGARLGERSIVTAAKSVRIGAGAVVGDWALVADTDPGWAGAVYPVEVGEGALLGQHAVVGPGASVPAGARIEPYAVVGAPISEP